MIYTPRTEKMLDDGADEIGMLHLCRTLEKELHFKTQECDLLREYGNKDCTAMADEALTRMRKEASYE